MVVMSYFNSTDGSARIRCLEVTFTACRSVFYAGFLADYTNRRAYATVLRSLSSVWNVIVAKQCVLEQKLLLAVCRKSYMGNRLVPK